MNQYLAVAALIAGGLYGVEHELELEPIFEGNAYVSDAPRIPSSLREAAALFQGSEIAIEAFGEDVVAHYLNNARIEQSAYDAAITDYRSGFVLRTRDSELSGAPVPAGRAFANFGSRLCGRRPLLG